MSCYGSISRHLLNKPILDPALSNEFANLGRYNFTLDFIVKAVFYKLSLHDSDEHYNSYVDDIKCRFIDILYDSIDAQTNIDDQYSVQEAIDFLDNWQTIKATLDSVFSAVCYHYRNLKGSFLSEECILDVKEMARGDIVVSLLNVTGRTF